MAWLEQHPTSGRFKICFRWAGRQHKKTIKITNRQDAEAVLTRLEETIGLAQRGRLKAPPDADIATFLLSDGQMSRPPQIEAPSKPLALGELRDLYLKAHSQGAMEANSLQTVTSSHLQPKATTRFIKIQLRSPFTTSGFAGWKTALPIRRSLTG